MKINCLAVEANPGGALHQKFTTLATRAVSYASAVATTAAACLTVVLLIAAATHPALTAATVDLSWNANPEPDIAGYRVSYGTTPGIFPNSIQVGKTTTASVTGLAEGATYYFVVAAINQADQQGAASDAVSHLIPFSTLIPSTAWSLKYADSEESSDYRAAYAFDGDPSTIWHTSWSNPAATPPHEIQINLGSSRNLIGFRYLPRGGSFLVGNVGQFEFYVSPDGVNWGNPIAASTFPNTGELKEVRFTEISGQFVKFRGLTDANGGTYMSVAELYLLQGSTTPSNNQAPVATAKSVSTSEDLAIPITLSGTDADGNPLTYSTTNPSKGALSGTAPNLTYTPHANSNGNDSFTFRVNDGTVNSAYATVSITVTAVNDAPVAISKSTNTLKDTALPISLTGSDLENNSLTFSVVSIPANGILSGTAPNLTYTPATGYTGNDQFTFKASDGFLDSATATISITVAAPPVTGGFTVLPRTGWSLKYTDSQETSDSPANFAFDGNTNTFWHTQWRANTPATMPHEIQINLGSTQSICGFQYLPRQDGYSVGNIGKYEFYVSLDGTNWGSPVANGTFTNTPLQKQITFTSTSGKFIRLRALSASNGGTETSLAELNILTGTHTNQAPSASSQSITTSSNTPFNLTLSGSDPTNSPITFSILKNPTNGTLSGTAPNLTYLPNPNFVGSDQFTFFTNDGAINSTAATVSITITGPVFVPGNSAPAFTGPVIADSAQEEKFYQGQLIAHDPNPDDILTFSKLSGPAWLTVTASGTLIGTPLNAHVGTNTFSVKVTDQHDASATATVVLTVANINNPPIFTSSPTVYPAGIEKVAYRGQTLAPIAHDPDLSDTLTYSKVSGPVWLTLAPDGSLKGTPPSGSAGNNIFTIRATDSSGTSAESILEIKINTNTLPLPWKLELVGHNNLAGPANYSAGVFTVAGSGALDEKSDATHFGWQNLSGDGEISARIAKLDDTGNATRVGLMIRDSLAPDARQAFIGLNGNGDLRWFKRSKTGEKAHESARKINGSSDIWLKLVRADNTITAYRSTNGTKWIPAGSIQLKLPQNCYIGLSVSSGDPDLLNTSKFSNVRVTP